MIPKFYTEGRVNVNENVGILCIFRVNFRLCKRIQG